MENSNPKVFNEHYFIPAGINLYNKSKCILEYSYIVTEPEYEEFEKYPINTSYGELFNEQKHRYIGKPLIVKI